MALETVTANTSVAVKLESVFLSSAIPFSGKSFSFFSFLPLLFCIFLFLSFISFLSVLVYFSFSSHIDGKWEAGCRACVHRTSYGRAHRLSTLVVSQFGIMATGMVTFLMAGMGFSGFSS